MAPSAAGEWSQRLNGRRGRRRFGAHDYVYLMGWFCWQEGFGAFSYGHSQLKGIIEYIGDQERHHARTSFRDEYLRFLKRFEIEHDEKYTFKPLD
jgi:putative transposase